MALGCPELLRRQYLRAYLPRSRASLYPLDVDSLSGEPRQHDPRAAADVDHARRLDERRQRIHEGFVEASMNGVPRGVIVRGVGTVNRGEGRQALDERVDQCRTGAYPSSGPSGLFQKEIQKRPRIPAKQRPDGLAQIAPLARA